MPCYHPLAAFQDRNGQVEFKEGPHHVRSLFLSCGQCIGCRIERSRQWAVRIMHEAQLHEENSYVTLTYGESLDNPSLVYRDFQLFMKRLRKQRQCWDVTSGLTVPRFFMAGEYGEKKKRPHFHACLFGADWNDRIFFKKSGQFNLYTSARLERLWPHGYSTTGTLTFESAQYVAGYITKKITGDLAEGHYRIAVDDSTGEVSYREPEFCHMSLKPGIGQAWLERFHTDIYPHGMVVVNGKETNPPRYYDKWFKKREGESDVAARLAELREGAARLVAPHRTDERLAAREEVAKARLKLSRRKI